MKLGLITAPCASGIDHVANFGLNSAEFDINIGSDIDAFEAELPAIEEAMQRRGVSVDAIGRWGPDRITIEGPIEQELKTEYRLIDAAARLGTPVYITGCNAVEGLSFYQNCTLAIEYMEKLLEYAMPKGVKVATYNCHWNSFLDCDPAWTVVHGHLKELGIKFDPSHAIYAGRDVMSEMKQWGDRFVHVHLKGSLRVNGERIDDPPAGMDDTNWGAFMAMLYTKKYDGALAIEPHSETWQGEMGHRGIQYTIDYFRKMILA